ncbi:MAG: acetyl-CoA C-acetyltransferase [Spirochaetota bacterium]
MGDVVIVSVARTAVGSFGGTLKATPAIQLGSLVLNGVLKKAGLKPVATNNLTQFEPDSLKGVGMIPLEKKGYDYSDSLKPVEIDEVLMGNVLASGLGQNPARQSAIMAGIPKETPAFTVSKVCASGLKAIALGAQSIKAGDAEVVLAGGQENMSLVPYALPAARWGARMNNVDLVDLMVFDGLYEIFYGYHMGITAENIAAKYGISRKEQDELGVLSHARARKAIKEGLFKNEIIPVVIPQKKGNPLVFDTDERPMDTTLEKMSELKPAFKKDGSITAGNASGINDAAAAVLLMSDKKAKELGLKPLAKVKAFASGGLDPAYMGLGPVPAVRKIFKKTGVTIKDIGVIELNEAFAAQAISCVRELKADMDKTNIVGSGVSIGHPVGCSGARLIVTLVGLMQRGNHELGLASLCIGGGQGMAMLLEKA